MGDMFSFDETWRRIREKNKYKGFECFACNHRFRDGERFGIAITDKGNKTVCNDCARAIKKELKGDL